MQMGVGRRRRRVLGDDCVAEMVTGVPVSDVLLALETPGSTKQRVEAAGLFQRVQAVIAHAAEEGAVGVKQPVEPVDQHAGREQVEQRLVARGLAARRRLGMRQPVGTVAAGSDTSGAAGCSTIGFRRVGYRRRFGCGAGFAFEPRRQLPRELVEGAVFDRRQRRRFRLAHRPKRQDVFGGFHGVFQIGWV